MMKGAVNRARLVLPHTSSELPRVRSPWPSSALQGRGDDRFARAEENIEHRLAQQTVGLVSAEAFREKREAVEAEEAGKREREEAARLQRKQAKKAKREQQEKRGLSFVEEDE